MNSFCNSATRLADLGCGPSSPFRHIKMALNVGVDLEASGKGEVGNQLFLRGDIAQLPFADGSFTVVAANHSLEHVEDMNRCLAEMARIIRPDGLIYIAVPIRTTLSDRLYRWIYSGGGHIQRIESIESLEQTVSALSGLPCMGRIPIDSGFHFLTSKDVGGLGRRRRWLIQWMTPRVTTLLTYGLSLADRMLGTMMRLYGSELYFGHSPELVPEAGPRDTCTCCGQIHAVKWLRGERGYERYGRWLGRYDCPACGHRNLFVPERD